MSSADSNERGALLGALNGQREHVFEALQGLDLEDLQRPVLPSGWTCLGLVSHLSVDVEYFWFQAVVAGAQGAIDEVLGSSGNAWGGAVGQSAETVLQAYRGNIELADRIIETSSLDAAPEWWPDFFGSWHLDSVREVVLHVVTETATHAGHLDAARELIDGKQHLVLAE